VLGGISYLGKSYCFPYFLASFTLISLWSALISGEKWKRLCGCYLLGISLFLAISIPWVVVISKQHQKPTIGTAGAFTLQFKAPNMEVSPTEDQGFLPPPSDYAVSYWESPGKLPTKGWSPFNSKSDFEFYTRVVLNNFFDAVEAVNAASVLLVGLIAVAGMLELSRTLEHRPRSINPTLGLILLLAVYAAGYILIFIAPRYLWSVSIGGILMGCLAIQRLEERALANRFAVAAFVLVYVGCCYLKSTPLLARLFNFGKEYYTLSLSLDEIRGSRVASNDFLRSLKLAYYQKAKFFGIPLASMEPAAVAASLKENRIDYFFLWHKMTVPPYLDGFEKVKEFPGVQIFRPKAQPQE
jgi:hypothetical protein